ncbi:hypothetical protein, partial [[Ruminococcus] lactaris]
KVRTGGSESPGIISFLFYRKQYAFDSFIIPDAKIFSSRFFAKEKRCRNLLTPLHLLTQFISF